MLLLYETTFNCGLLRQSTRSIREYNKVMNTNIEDIIYDVIVDVLDSIGVVRSYLKVNSTSYFSIKLPLMTMIGCA